MVRFKVVKGSQVLLCAAIAILALVIGILIFSAATSGTTVSAQANLVNGAANSEEAKTGKVFASSELSGALLLDPESSGTLTIEVVSPEAEKTAPSVLIYHTHTHEAYEQTGEDRYVAIEAWRTADSDHSIVKVGAELARLLSARGFEVVHDTTDHEQNELSTAYTRSLKTLEGYERTFDLYIDLHRDAYIEGAKEVEVFSGERRLAQLMTLIGNGVGFDIKPYYEQNLAFAQRLTERINRIKSGLCKDVLVKDGRYNQNIGIFSILIEVGHNRNTLTEALDTLPYLADALQSLMISEPDAELVRMQQAFIAENG